MGDEAQCRPQTTFWRRDVCGDRSFGGRGFPSCKSGLSVAREAGHTMSSPQSTEHPKWCTPMNMVEKVEGEARALSDLDKNRRGGTKVES